MNQEIKKLNLTAEKFSKTLALVTKELEKYLPISRVEKRDDGLLFLNYDYPESIGYIASFYGNFGVILKAYIYILLLGKEGQEHIPIVGF